MVAHSSTTLLKSIFGVDYINQDRRPGLNTVLEAENDELKAIKAIEKLAKANNPFLKHEFYKPRHYLPTSCTTPVLRCQTRPRPSRR